MAFDEYTPDNRRKQNKRISNGKEKNWKETKVLYSVVYETPTLNS